MEEYKLIAAKTLTATDQQLYSNTSGAIIKTILLYNSKETESEATLLIDSVAFKFKVGPGDTVVLDSPILTKNLKGTGEGINIHISGIQL